MLSCKELVRALASEELEEAGRRKRLAVKFHLVMCRHCRRYASQLKALRSTAKRLWGTEADAPDPDQIARLARKILKDGGMLPGS